MTEAKQLTDDVRTVYRELFPGRNPEAMQISDGALALGVLLRREMRAAARAAVSAAEMRRFQGFDPKDPE